MAKFKGKVHKDFPYRVPWSQQDSVPKLLYNYLILKFLLPLSVLPFDPAAASEYGEIRAYLQGQCTPIGPLDTARPG